MDWHSADGVARILVGDCLQRLRDLPDCSVQCCVTSPPYWGLRDYGNDAQLGLESTPEKYVENMVAVFREVRRVLRPNGTLWLNLGDSYAGSWGNYGGQNRGKGTQREITNGSKAHQPSYDGLEKWRPPTTNPPGLKPKDLVGIPWRVAFALQQPFYTGKIPNENDRVWLAAMVDAEGSICGTEYETGDRTKTNIYICVTNTSTRIIDKCERLFPQEVKHVYEKTNSASGRRCFRWDVERIEMKSMFLREIYPHLVAKRRQAILAYTFLEMQRGLASKKKGYLPEQHDQRSWLMSALSRLNAGEDIDIPEWCVEPPSLNEPGFYLRQDIIWHKPSPMPESVRDRCTKAHEYIFLLSKSQRYYYDAEAIREDGPTYIRRASGYTSPETQGCYDGRRGMGFANNDTITHGRNRRSVWKVSTKPYKGAHFATMPPDLVEPCILAGTSEAGCCESCGAPLVRQTSKTKLKRERPNAYTKRTGEDGTGNSCANDVAGVSVETTGWLPSCDCNSGAIPCLVLDPFGGSGTTVAVAAKLGRRGVCCELNPEYVKLAVERITPHLPGEKHPLLKG